jgi:hypothetical protein
MGEMRQKVAARTTRNQPRQQWPVRSSLLAAGAVVALGALAACSAGVGNTASLSSGAIAQTGAATVSGGVDGLGVPAVISRAIASGSAIQSSGSKATHKHAAKKQQPKAKGSATAKSSPSPSSSSSPSSGSTQPTPTQSNTTPPSSTPTGGGGGDPSGADPATSLAGFTLNYTQEFNSGSAPSGWQIYEGVPGGESSSVADWEPSMCTFSGGEAHFMADGVDSCGMKYQGSSLEYGAFFARLQAPAEPSSQQFSDIFLLWAANLDWPPEIDIYEDKAEQTRTTATMFNTENGACGSSPSISCLEQYEQGNDAENGVANTDTEWHTYGVEWTPSGVSWLIDGNVVFSAPASQAPAGAQQPAQPMNMSLQSENLSGGGTPTLRSTMNVDWVEQFSYNG